MGIAVPRPQMRSKERRTIEASLREHAEIMQRLENEGMSREAASAEAARVVRANRKGS